MRDEKGGSLREFLEEHRSAIRFSLVMQVAAVLFAAIVLDEGTFACVTALVILFYWGVVAVIGLRHRDGTRAGQLFLKWGFLLLWGIWATLAFVAL